MAAVTVLSDFGAWEEEICLYFHIFPFYLPCNSGARCHDLSFLTFILKPTLLLSSLTLIKRLFNSSSFSAFRVVSSEYLRLLMFLLPILNPACYSCSALFLMMCSVYRLKNQGNSRLSCCSRSFLILNQSVVPYRVLTVAYWLAYRFLRRQVRWCGSPISKSFPQFLMIQSQRLYLCWWNRDRWFFFLKFPCFFYNPVIVSNLISGSSFFSKLSLDIWKFLVCIMLKPSMQDFKHDLTSMGDEYNYLMLAYSLVLPFLGIGMKIGLFQSCSHCWVFQIFWHNEHKTLTALSFRDLNSSAGISLHLLALLIAVFPKAHLTLHSKISGSGWLPTPL